jgi:hypothetical protein
VKKTAFVLLAGLLILSVIGEFGWVRPHGTHHAWDVVPGFYIWFGFAGAVILVLAAKWLGKVLLLKDKDYYDR